MPDEPPRYDQADIEELARAVRALSERVHRLEARLDSGRAEIPVEQPRHVLQMPPPPARSAKSGLESRIGSQWLNRVGVVAFLFGVAYLLRFVAGWLSAVAWVWFGTAAGVAVIVGSEWFRARGYRVLSLSLKATGVGITYLSLWAGLELYKVVPAAVTFAGLVLLTLLNAALALWESSQLLGALALIAGFLTPLLISVPSREAPLFLWLATLDVAASAIATKRSWWKLLPLSLAGTVALSTVWYLAHYQPADMISAVFAATIFFAIFVAAGLAIHRTWPASNSTLLLAFEVFNASFYFVALDLLLGRRYDDALGAAAFALATLYFWLASKEHPGPPTPARSVAAYGGLGIAFVAIALAVLLNSDWLSLGWFLEAAVVIAIGFWRDLSWIRWGALALLSAAVVKAFAFDVWQLSLGYRTISFIGLGILLLVISFAYQRYGFAMNSKAPKGPTSR